MSDSELSIVKKIASNFFKNLGKRVGVIEGIGKMGRRERKGASRGL